MAIRNIVLEGDPILKKKCREVVNFDAKLETLVEDMIDTLKKAKGLGLAAPQVGIMRRLCIVLAVPNPMDYYNTDEDFDEEEYDEEDFDDEEYDEEDDEIEGEFIEFINPEILSTEGSITFQEGCLSYPGRTVIVTRPLKATVRAFDRYGKEFTCTLDGINARCICHECNHLDGITIEELDEGEEALDKK